MKTITYCLAITVMVFFSANNLFAQTSYFQQEVNYKIEVKLNDVQHTLDAKETIIYKNNSPDVLKELWFHIWPNAYSKRNTALVKQQLENGSSKLYFATDDEKGFIDSLNFSVNGKTVRWEYHPEWIDVCKLLLNEPLNPNTSITITTPFHVKIPSSQFSRLGHTDQAYYISQWFPKPAVYDNKGWHAMPYLDQGEFYSEFGSFEVSITLPKNYVVGATGDLMNDNELQRLNYKAEETKSMTTFSKDMSFPKSDTEFKTLTYKQTNVHDFAWFADKRFHVLKGEIETPHTHNKVTTWTMFTNNEAALWMKSIEYMNDAIYYYSLWNGDYPYKQCTAVDGTISAGGGMEYPNITIIGESGNDFTLEDVIVHEVGHNWFYGMLGSNERDHGWMDEGLNSFNELRYVMTKYPPSKFANRNDLQALGSVGKLMGTHHLNFKQAWDFEYQALARINGDQAITTASQEFTPTNYALVMYRKTALVFDYLKSYLGDSLFDECMKSYFDQWHFKHPYPEDIKRVFEQTTSKNLDWFFDDLLNTNKKIDYAICSEKNTGNVYTLTLSNCGEVRGPVMINTMKADSILASTWIEGFDKQQQVTITCEGCTHFIIDAGYNIPDVKRKNNAIRSGGWFKKIEPISLNLLGHLEYPQRTRLSFLPAVAWNEYNKWMVGIALYNKFIPEKKFEYVVVPLFGFGDNEIAGTGNVSYSLFPKSGLFDRVSLSVGTKRFAYLNQRFTDENLNSKDVTFHYNRISPELVFSIRKSTPRSSVRQNIQFSSVYVNENDISYFRKFIVTPDTSFTFNFGNFISVERSTFRAAYTYSDSRTLDPFSFSFSGEGNKDYLKLMLNVDYLISYPKSKKGVQLHLFAGGFGFDNSKFAYPFYLSGWNGLQDAWYDELYFGRSETTELLSRQIVSHDAGFKVDVPYARSNKWMASINITAAIPNLPISVFADFGTFENAKRSTGIFFNNGEGNSLLFDGGICIDASFIKVYLPVFKSKDVKEYQSGNNGLEKINFGEQIRFELNLNKLNPFNLRKQIAN